MNREEFDYWREITASSSYRWQEDTITRLNGRGALYYMGGESGAFIRMSPEGMLKMGTYEEAIPHIGEAFFTVKAEKSCGSFNAAFQFACQLGGRKFLEDMFSNDKLPRNMLQSAQSTIVQSDQLSQNTEEANMKNDSAISM
ncbi:MAG: hypothetical protein LUK37_16335 [Clostridia bacterium]|nr:hypothetical protein [Clostridia bacterium]